MDTQLILVDGHSSVGKSSVSKSVWKQLNLELPAYWLHEECEHHPIREGEFRFGALDTPEGMELNRVGMLKKWRQFRDSIAASGQVCVTEGCLLHAYDRYFIHSVWSENEIDAYYAQVIDVLRELNPVLVLLHRPDLRASLEQAFLARGDWWRELMLKRDDLHVYFKTHAYQDENSMFAAIAYEQKRILEIFDRLQCTKIRIDTSAEQWARYDREILALCGSAYREVDPHPCELKPYAGSYRRADGGGTSEWVIQVDEANRCLYTTLFWPYMPMRCLAEGVFELISFPVELHFQQTGNGLRFQVRGNYDWEINDQWFVRE